MKKSFLILLICILSLQTKAQFIDHDFSASYGIVTTDQIADIFKDVLTTVFTFGTYTKEDYNYSGALFLTYKKSLTYRLQFGGTLGIDQVSGNLLQNDIVYGTFNTKHTTIAAEMDSRWVKRDFLQVYTGVGLGYTFSSEKGEIFSPGQTERIQNGHINFQLNLLGIRFGRTFGGFIETGFGYKGILNFGLSYQFE